MPALSPGPLATQRLRLRELVCLDAAAIFEAYTRYAEGGRFMIWQPHASEAVTRQLIAWRIVQWKTGERLPYVVTRLESDAAIGMIEARPQGTTLDIGYADPPQGNEALDRGGRSRSGNPRGLLRLQFQLRRHRLACVRRDLSGRRGTDPLRIHSRGHQRGQDGG